MKTLGDAQALVLDFGGVISRMLFETHDLSEEALCLKPGTLNWKGPFDPATDPLWQSMQADEISADFIGQCRGPAVIQKHQVHILRAVAERDAGPQ